MSSPLAAALRSGTYEVVPGSVVTAQGGISGETRTYGVFGTLELVVELGTSTASVVDADIQIRPQGLASVPFPANDLLALSELSTTLVSSTELRMTEPEHASEQVELVVTEDSGGLLLNGSYTEPCCDRYAFTFVDMALIPQDDGDLYLPGIASTEGVNGSYWLSDVEVFNPEPQVMAVSLSYVADEGMSSIPPRTYEIESGGSESFKDVVAALAPLGAPLHDSKGYLHITSDRGAPLVTASTYNVVGGSGGGGDHGATGQALFPFTRDHLIPAGGQAYLVGLCTSVDLSTGKRSYIGLLNTSATTRARVRVVKYLAANEEVSMFVSKTYTLKPGQFVQRSMLDDFGVLEDEACANLRVEVEAGGPVAAYGTVVDNLTNDPIMHVAQLVE